MMGKMPLRLMAVGAGILLLIAMVSSGASRAKRGQEIHLEHVLSLGHEHLFGELERPAVLFKHDRHTQALKGKDCDTCHTLKEKVKARELLVYAFPKERGLLTRQALMDGYHSACLGCHKELLKEDKKTGPVTCGECHLASPPTGLIWQKAGYDYALHNQHAQAMESKCEICHHIYDETQQKLIYQKGTESSCQDCHGARDEDNRRSLRKVSHAQCLDCHLRRDKAGQTAGPGTCRGCHGERERTGIKEMAKLPRLDRGQKDKILIKPEGGRMKAVPFDHKAHEGLVTFCSDCHHHSNGMPGTHFLLDA